YEKQNRNAEKIAAMAGGLHDQFVLVLESLDEVGQNIKRTQTAFDTAQKRLHTGKGNVVKKIHELEKLGAKTKKRLPASIKEQALDDEQGYEDLDSLVELPEDIAIEE